MAAAVAAAVAATNSDVTRQDQSLQTDAFLIYPYEHLFPSVLPSWFACHHTGKVCCRRNMISYRLLIVNEQPHSLLIQI